MSFKIPVRERTDSFGVGIYMPDCERVKEGSFMTYFYGFNVGKFLFEII